MNVATLEKKFGVRLFDRGTHGAEPTVFGRVVLERGAALVRDVQALHGEIGGYALFFLGTAVTGVPALLLCLLLARRIRAPTDAPLAGRGPPG